MAKLSHLVQIPSSDVCFRDLRSFHKDLGSAINELKAYCHIKLSWISSIIAYSNINFIKLRKEEED